ncbi:MAG TPA: hypothetical protein VIZ68_05335 [Thermoplasmata archaeon]
MTVTHLPPLRASPSLPLGVAILAVLIGVIGFLLLVVSIAIIVLYTGLAFLTQFSFFGAGVLGGVLLLIFSIVLLVVAFGLWNLEMWALALSVIVVLILFISNAIQHLVSISTAVLLLLLVYLVLVRHHFR